MSTDEINDGEDTPEAGAEVTPDDEDGAKGVFGNLPTTRPGARSPRRGDPAASSDPGPGAATEAASGAPAAEPPPPPSREGRPEPSPGTTPDPAGGGIEDVAWAGVAAAAEAATIGVRLATRALEAMRDAVDRR